MKAKIDAKATNCYDRRDLEPAWTRYSLPVPRGTAEPVNEDGPESPIGGRNSFETGSEAKGAAPRE